MRAADLAQRVTRATSRGEEWLAICPAHDDQKPSLTFRDGDKGVVLKCQAGCPTEAVCERIGLHVRDLFFDTAQLNGRPTRRIVKTYDYRDEENELLYQVVRYEPKDFRQRRPNGKGGWSWDVKGIRPVAYQLPNLAGQPRVYIPEGEQDVERLRSVGLSASCNSGGAGKWSDAHTQQLKAIGVHEVIILPDNDEPGRRHAQAVAGSCFMAGLVAKIVTLPNLPPKGDVSDFLDAGKTVEDLNALVEAASCWTPESAVPTIIEPVVFRLTDLGNAELFTRQHRGYARYCYPLKMWFVCNKTSLWEPCAGNLIAQLAKASIIGLYDEAKHETNDEQRTKLAAHAVKSENVQRLQAMIDLARSEPGIAISPNAFDADPWVFSVVNGVLDLRTGLLRTRQRDDLITKQSPVVFDASASCPMWLRFLGQIFRDEQGLISYLQHIVGYCLTGVTIEQAFFLLWGSGSNGKSTLLKVLLKLFGDYGLQVPADTFLSRMQDGRATPDLARLQGARLAVAIESDEGCHLAEGTIKQMTGGDRIAARRLYQDFIEFDPTHKILFGTNHKPRVKDNTHAMWRRMRLIPFEVQIADHEQDLKLADKLFLELPGILNWALAGCLAWQYAGRLETPAPVQVATASYRTDQDALDDFLREQCVCGPEHVEMFAELRKAYVTWAQEMSDKPMSSKAFGVALSERGYLPIRRSNARYYTGLRLRSVADADMPTSVAATQGGADVDFDT